MIKIKVIIDRFDPRLRRTCFWNLSNKGGRFRDYEMKFISITDIMNSYFILSSEGFEELSKGEIENLSPDDVNSGFNPFFLPDLFNLEKTQILIINWDSINGDPVYGSDRTHQFFKHYMHSLYTWVQKGGIVIVECQSSQWKLIKEAYQIFDESIQVTDEIKKYRKIAYIDETIREFHPILLGIDRQIEPDAIFDQKLWFPRTSTNVSAQAKQNLTQNRKLSVGWFTGYSDQWTPILYSDTESEKPVMLCKILSNIDGTNIGAFILTTMYLGTLGEHPLISNILNLSNKLDLYFDHCKIADFEKPKIFEPEEIPFDPPVPDEDEEFNLSF